MLVSRNSLSESDKLYIDGGKCFVTMTRLLILVETKNHHIHDINVMK